MPRREAQSISVHKKRTRLLLNSFKVGRLVYISWDLIIPRPSPGCQFAPTAVTQTCAGLPSHSCNHQKAV